MTDNKEAPRAKPTRRPRKRASPPGKTLAEVFAADHSLSEVLGGRPGTSGLVPDARDDTGAPVRPSRTRPRPEPVGVPHVRANAAAREAQGDGAPPPPPVKVHLWPVARGVDDGQGGVRRVVEGMQGALAAHGVALVDSPEDAEVIASHIQIPGGWLARWPEKAFVAHCHGLYWSEFEWQQWTQEANELVIDALCRADACTVPTEWVANAVRRHTSREPVVVPHGIDAEAWAYTNEKKGYVLWDKTRPDPVCDPKDLNALAALRPSVPFVTTYGEAAVNVTVTGRLPFEDAKRLFEGASAYLSTARETFGVSILQAWACGIPVVGWRWGGALELVTEGETGFLARPGDFEELALKLDMALQAGPRLRERCREEALKYTWHAAAEQYAALYRRTLEEHRRGPRTSIIITAYNLEKYLPAAIDSALQQTDPDLEVIIVDDNSPDHCGRIADEYARADPRVKVVHNERNLYLAGARNVGIAASTGRYILPLDADDLLPPRAVEHLADYLDRDRTVDIAYGGVMFVDEDGRTPKIYDRTRWTPGHSGWPIDFSWELQLRGVTVDSSGQEHAAPNCLPYSSMYRRRVAEMTGGYRERCRTQEDADFWARVSSYGFRPKRAVEADTLIYRVRESSMSHVQPRGDHTAWLGWRRADIRRAPAGAVAGARPPVTSFDPPGIAVIIPVGPGHERHAQTAVDSVEAQTWRGWECIVVNDTGEPLPRLFPSWVKVVNTPGRRGPGYSRNAGARHARAKLYVWLDADDFLQPEALEAFYASYTEGLALETGATTSYYCDAWEDVSGTWKRLDFPHWSPEAVFHTGMIGAVTRLVPKAAHDLAGGFDEELKAWEDYDYTIRLIHAGTCSRRIAQPLFSYRKGTGKRRDYSVENFEISRDALLDRWPQYWRGEPIVACNSCGRAAASTVGQNGTVGQSQQAALAAATQQGLVALIYVGARDADHSYRSNDTGRTYRFARGRWAWVDPRDAQWLLSLPGFRPYTPQALPEAAKTSPTLAV